TYTATIKGGANGVADLWGNTLAADRSWSVSTDTNAPPILVLTSASNPFSSYLTEILRGEGMNEFTALDVSYLSASLLGNYQVVLLGNVALSSSQAGVITSWVQGGGNLIAMRPDKDLTSLLGLFDMHSTLSNAYLKVDTSKAPGVGIVGST